MDLTTTSIDQDDHFGPTSFAPIEDMTNLPVTSELLLLPTEARNNDLSLWRTDHTMIESHTYDDISMMMTNDTDFDNRTGQNKMLDSTNWHVFMYYLIGTTGILDNGLVILIIMLRKSMRRKICNMLIINQSIIDCLASLLLIVNSPLVVKMRIPSNILPDFYCRFWANSFLLWSTFGISTLNLILLTVERFAEIVYPLKYKVHITQLKSIIAISLIWILGFLIEFSSTGYTSIPIGQECALYVAYPSEAVRILNSIMRYILAIILPITVMTYCYTRMIRAMREVHPALQSLSVSERARQQRQDKVRRNLLKAMLTVCVAYVMCVGWNQTYFFLINLGVNLPFGTPFYHFTVYAQFLNCLINPIIYTAKYREFQLSAKKLLKVCLPMVQSGTQSDDGKVNTQQSAI